MNVEIGTVAAQFHFWEYLFRIFRYWFVAVCDGRLEGGLTHAALTEAWYLCRIILKEMSPRKACIVKGWIDCMCQTMSYMFFDVSYSS